jgi:hypothetical protein
MDVSVNKVVIDLLSEFDRGQFNEKLFGCFLETNPNTDENVEINPEDEEDEDDDENSEHKCPECGNSCCTANDIMTDHINKCQNIMKNTKKSGNQFLRDPMVTSLKLRDYIIQDVYSWQPEKMLQNGRSLKCWNTSCHKHEGTEFSRQLIITFKINLI